MWGTTWEAEAGVWGDGRWKNAALWGKGCRLGVEQMLGTQEVPDSNQWPSPVNGGSNSTHPPSAGGGHASTPLPNPAPRKRKLTLYSDGYFMAGLCGLLHSALVRG